jgi:hypothetical protein
VVVIVITVIVMVVVVVVVIVVVSILGDASRAERNLGLRRAPVADALQLSRVIVVLVITLLRDAHNRATCSPAAARNVVVLELGCDSHISGEHEATESEQLLSTHVVRVLGIGFSRGFENDGLDLNVVVGSILPRTAAAYLYLVGIDTEVQGRFYN